LILTMKTLMQRTFTPLAFALLTSIASAQYPISQQPYTLSSPAAGDLTVVVDVSDTTQSASGTTKKATLSVLRDYFLGSSATLPIANGGTGSTTASAARTALGLAIGTDVQAYHATLAAVSGSTYTGDDAITTLGTVTTGTWNGTTIAIANGGTGSTTAANARTALGLAIGSDVQAYNATLAAVSGSTYTGDDAITTLGTVTTGTWNGTTIAIANGGTGSTTASDARTALGLAIGSDVQAYNATLAAVAGSTYTGDDAITTLGTVTTGTWNGATIAIANGGTGSTTAANARTALGLAIGTDVQAYNAATTILGSDIALASEVSGTLPVANGGTGITAFGTGVATALGQNVSGSGSLVLGTSPTITTPTFSGAMTFPDNVRQTFNPGTDNAGINVGSLAGDPTTLVNGDLWYDSASGELTARIAGNNVALADSGGTTVTIGDVTASSFTNLSAMGTWTGTGLVTATTNTTSTTITPRFTASNLSAATADADPEDGIFDSRRTSPSYRWSATDYTAGTSVTRTFDAWLQTFDAAPDSWCIGADGSNYFSVRSDGSVAFFSNANLPSFIFPATGGEYEFTIDIDKPNDKAKLYGSAFVFDLAATTLAAGWPITFSSTSTFTGAVTLNGAATFNSTATFESGLSTGSGDDITGSGAITTSSSTEGLGYATGAGGTVTQATSRTTGVTLNKTTGAITTHTASLAAAAEATFTVTNSTVAATDTVVLSIKSGAAATPLAWVSAVAAGSFNITISNLHASTAETGAIVINFAVIKAVAN
jgi:hypothetical protein